MKRIIHLLLVSLFAIQSAWADDISREQAISIAQQFVKQDARANARRRVKGKDAEPSLAHAVKSKSSQKDNVYVINLGEDQGFVIVAGDDRADVEILGYCDHGTFDYDKAPVQLKDLLGNYSDGIEQLRDGHIVSSRKSTTSVSVGDNIGTPIVGPLIKTSWYQEWPYNLLCPGGCPTGCTNTAIAQIMYYFRWPNQAHSCIKDGIDYGATTVYDWDKMKASYDWNTSEDEQLAVAKLMADIGRANLTSYAPGGSSAGAHVDILSDVFDYEPRAKILMFVGNMNKADTLKAILNTECPVFYGAYPLIGDGHAMVCDGYTSNNYFSFNFGWGGEYNGYYKLTSVKGFNYNAHIIQNFRPYTAKRVEIDGIRYECKDNGEAFLFQFRADEIQNPDLVVPDEVEVDGTKYKVTSIGNKVFQGIYPGFNSVTIGKNVRTIGERAFINTDIKKLVLGDAVEKVGDLAFWASNIKDLTIGASPIHIGKRAFETCSFNSVSSQSSAIDVDDMAFYSCGIKGDMSWLKSIRSVGKKAFAGTDFYGSGDARFDNLEQMADSAFYGIGGDAKFVLGPRLRNITPTAIHTTNVNRIYIDEANPYYATDSNGNIYTKDFTTLVCYNPTTVFAFDARALRIADGAIPSLFRNNKNNKTSIYIPRNMQDVRGAFKHCDLALSIYCHAAIPPLANDETFNDQLFDPYKVGLYVPAGCREAYENAPGWRRFRGNIHEDTHPQYTVQEEELPPVEREYYMVAHGKDFEGGSMQIPVSQVQDISVVDKGSSQQLQLRINTGSNLICDILNVDSISWQPGFLYGAGYVSEVGEDKLEAYGRTSKVTFDATIFDEDTQVSIRESVLAPTSLAGVVSGNVVSIELADGKHQLDGTACISIDLPCDDKHIPVAAYFNKETGKWEPIAHIYNKETQQMEIHTSHLSEFGAFVIDLENSVKANFRNLYECVAPYGIYDLYQTLANLESLCLNDEQQAEYEQFMQDEALWQQLYLDGGYTAISAFLGESPLMEELKGFVGNLGTLITVCDLLHADYTGDRQAVVEKSLNLVLAQAQNLAGTLFGTPVLTASMSIVGLVGFALNKFGTSVQEARTDLFRRAMSIFYSKEHSNHYRSARDWYRLILPIYREPRTQQEMNDTIDKLVTDYCCEVWKNENYDEWNECLSDAMSQGWKADGGLTSIIKGKLSQEMRAELYNGVLVSVFTAAFRKITEESEDRALAAQSRYVEFMNRPIIIRFKDSSCPKGERSRYAGLKLRMVGAPETGDEAEEWTTTVGEDGSCVFQLSTIAYIHNRLPGQFALQKANGDEVAAYDFKLPDALGAKRVVIGIDLATQGVVPEKPVVKGLNMEFTPSLVHFPYETIGPVIIDGEISHIRPEEEKRVYNPIMRLVVNDELVGTELPWKSNEEAYTINDEYHAKYGPDFLLQSHKLSQNPHAGILQYFAQHDDIRIDAENRAVYIGPDLVGGYDVVSGMGSGKFKIVSQYPFVEQNQEEYASKTHYVLLGLLLDEDVPLFKGQMKYELEGTFTVEYDSTKDAYQVYFEADGTYQISFTHASRVRTENQNAMSIEEGVEQHVIIEGTSTDDINGKVKLKCTRMLQTAEQEMNNQ
ncbi:MAG: C10 family peptidase [Bacteroidaceae bacterium]|nr:C10 family peptidase [Bacteroidaceae bacterium]